jgi:hypothetical protein
MRRCSQSHSYDPDVRSDNVGGFGTTLLECMLSWWPNQGSRTCSRITPPPDGLPNQAADIRSFTQNNLHLAGAGYVVEQ